METKFLKAMIVVFATICTSNHDVFSQFNIQNNNSDWWGSMDFTLTNPPEAIGVGDFVGTTPIRPRSALHIGTHTFTPNFYTAGEVFRTQAPSNVTQVWRMLYGSGAGTEVFNINNVNGSTNIQLGTVGNGNLNFFVNGMSNLRMTLYPSGNLDIYNSSTSPTNQNAYQIGANSVLWHNGITSNIYVGVGAGNSTPTGVNNTFVGFNSGNSNNTGFSNTFTGREAGFSNTSGHWNTFNGDSTGYHTTTGRQNTFMGHVAGFHNTTGYKNNFVGDSAGYSNTTGYSNWFGGVRSGLSNTGGRWNTFTGHRSGESNTTGDFNCFYGKEAGVSNVTGEDNCFYGALSGFRNTIGYYNCFYGNYSGQSNTIGYSNVFMGFLSGATLIEGHDNVIIGAGSGSNIGATAPDEYNTVVGGNAGSLIQGSSNTIVGGSADSYNTNSISNATALGALSVVMNSNQMILGDNNVNVGIGLSEDVLGPQAKLEIDAGLNGTTGVTGGTGESGLRFRDLNSNCTPITNPGTGVLGLNSSGDVIYVAGITGPTGAVGVTGAQGNTGLQGPTGAVGATGPGGVSACTGAISNFITKWTSPSEICNTIIFEAAANRIGISTTAPQAKLDVDNNDMGTGIFSHTNVTTSVVNHGVRGTSQGALFWNNGVVGQSPNNITFPGVPRINFGTIALNVAPLNAGVVGQAQGSTFNFGGIFEANTCPNNALNFGIYASARDGVFSNCGPGFAGFFQGNVYTTGAYLPVSDVILKDSINAIQGALPILASLYPKYYVFKRDSFPYMQLPIGKQFGLIAQQLDSVLPELVNRVVQPQITDTSGIIVQDSMTIKTINYTGLIPITIAAIQEQQLQIDSLVGDKITACGTTDSNYLAKWTKDFKVLCNSIIYDNGSRIGIPAPDDGAYVNVFNENDSVTAKFSSNYTGTTEVVKATYSTDGNSRDATAVSGYSKFIDDESKDGGLGGAFTGGQAGAVGKGVGTNTREFAVGLIGTAEGGGDVSAGVMGQVNVEEDVVHIGVVGMSENSTISNIGVGGSASEPNSVADNTGVYGIAGGSSIQNTAGYFTAYDTVGINYGVFAYADNSIGGNYAGYFDGNVHATGTVTWTSDGMLKDHVNDIDGRTALQQLLRLSPKTYRYKRDDYPFLALPQGNQYGLIAQEVERIFPELVADVEQPDIKDMKGRTIGSGFHYKGLNYIGLVPVLVSAVKQQQAKIDSLSHVITTRLDALEAKLNGCCGSGDANKTDNGNESTPNVNRISVELSSMQVIVLEQNVPNPFAEQTSISYYIPEGYRSAQMIFTDMLGHVIKTAEVNSGYGTVTVFASNLSTGQYSYTLVVDGKTVETKRMMKTK